MLVANAFDLWQKDSFFSAAEEVQESADILESAYRTWLSEKREGIAPDNLAELRRELQISLGTAKWQLEEFERAIKLSYGNCRDENRITRHQQFIVAIASQISRVENALRESLNEGKLPFQWVNLDEAEQDDLAMFISGVPGALKCIKEEYIKPLASSQKENLCFNAAKNSNFAENCDQAIGLNDDVAINMDTDCVIELNVREAPGTRDDVNGQVDRGTSVRRTWTLPNFSALGVVIPKEDEQRMTSMSCVQASSKGKASRISSSIYVNAKNWTGGMFRRFNGFNSVVQRPRHLHLSCSVRLMFILMLTIFLFVPFISIQPEKHAYVRYSQNYRI
ncbi:hypothetical protein Ancab_027763 [Ancistrocladus abbreviatus]